MLLACIMLFNECSTAILLLLLCVQPSIDSLVTSTPGTPAFMAPEMCGFKSTPYKPFPAECWALGVCLYMLVFGKGRLPHTAAAFTSSTRHSKPCVCAYVMAVLAVADNTACHMQDAALCIDPPRCGCCICWLLCAVPYSASSTGILYEFIRSAQPVEFPQLPAVSDELKKLLQELLDKHPDTRSTLEQVQNLW